MSATNPGGFIPERTEGDLVYRLNYQRFYKFEAFAPIGDPLPVLYQNEHSLHPFIPVPFPRFQIRETSRRTGLSRNTVRRYLRSDIVEPKFNVADRTSKLDPYADKLSRMLLQEAGRASASSPEVIKNLACDDGAQLLPRRRDNSYPNPATKRFPYALAGQGAQPLGSRR